VEADVVEAGRPLTIAGHRLGRGGAPHGEILASGASQLAGGVPHDRGWAGCARRRVGRCLINGSGARIDLKLWARGQQGRACAGD
jgi:hypothetical protein